MGRSRVTQMDLLALADSVWATRNSTVTVADLILKLCSISDLTRSNGMVRDVNAVVRVTRPQIAALDKARSLFPEGPAVITVGVIVDHFGRKVVAVGPFTSRGAAYEWWTVPGNKFKSGADSTGNPHVGFLVFTLPEANR
jgi:hypothetical protein